MDIQLSRRGVGNPVNGLTPPFLSQARTWLCNVICHCPYFMLIELRWEVTAWFIDIVGIDDHHCLNFLFIFSHFTLTVIIIRNFVAKHDNIYTLFPSINMLQYFDRFVCSNILVFLIALKFKWQSEHEELCKCHK